MAKPIYNNQLYPHVLEALNAALPLEYAIRAARKLRPKPILAMRRLRRTPDPIERPQCVVHGRLPSFYLQCIAAADTSTPLCRIGDCRRCSEKLQRRQCLSHIVIAGDEIVFQLMQATFRNLDRLDRIRDLYLR